MIFTPASTRRSATSWAAAAGTARTPTTISSLGDDRLAARRSRAPRRLADLGADDARVDVEHGDDLEAVVGEDVGAGDRLAEVAGAEEGDVVLAGGAQDLADLRDQRLDVVADPALAELAEAGEVAADLGRVDVRVLGEFLRGDRLAAHLAGLGQHLQVAREARGDARARGARLRPSSPSAASSSSITVDHAPTVSSLARTAASSRISSETTIAVDLDHRDPLEMAAQQQLVALDVDLVQLEAVALPVQGDERLERLLAEVAAGPRVDDDARAHAGPAARSPVAKAS